MLDGLYVEKEGIPCAVISTDAFIEQTKAMASAHSHADYSFTHITHPIANATKQQLEHKVERVLPNVLELLIESNRGVV